MIVKCSASVAKLLGATRTLPTLRPGDTIMRFVDESRCLWFMKIDPKAYLTQ